MVSICTHGPQEKPQTPLYICGPLGSIFCPSYEWSHLCDRCRLETGSWLLEPVGPAVT